MTGLLLQLKLLLRVLTLTRRKLIYQTALDTLGVDASPNDLAPDELGCAESVTNILNRTVGTRIITGTWTLNQYFLGSDDWETVYDPQPGDIVISPTGEGGKGKVGHTGIVGQNGIIMSNSSYTGKWSANYTVDSWREYYKTFPTYFYRLK